MGKRAIRGGDIRWVQCISRAKGFRYRCSGSETRGITGHVRRAIPEAFSLSSSTVSRRYIRASSKKLQELQERRGGRLYWEWSRRRQRTVLCVENFE